MAATHTMTTAWTEPRVARLKELHLARMSASQIADDLGECTRNSVIGKIHRLGLPPNPAFADYKTTSESRERASRRRRTARKIAAPMRLIEEELEEAFTGPLNILFAELGPRSCRWITNKEKPETFCGCRSVLNSSWCRFHRALAYHH